MADPIPLHQELYLPVVTPEMLKELANKKAQAKERLWSSVVIDLNGDEPEEKTPINSDS